MRVGRVIAAEIAVDFYIKMRPLKDTEGMPIDELLSTTITTNH